MDENEDAICNSEHVQDAFVFCPMIGSIQMESILAQGIFLSEQDMTQMEESRHSIYAKFSHITFEANYSTKSKLQTVEDVLKNMEINANEEDFYSSIDVSGIYSYEKDTTIENWLLNSVNNQHESSFNLPSDWVQVIEANKNNKWPFGMIKSCGDSSDILY